jgi:hypothetical protein
VKAVKAPPRSEPGRSEPRRGAARRAAAVALAPALALALAGGAAAEQWNLTTAGGREVAIEEDIGPAGSRFQLVRTWPDGRDDTTFGRAGRVELPPTGRPPYAVRADADGRLFVVGGAAAAGRPATPFVMRFSADGAPDSRWPQGRGEARAWPGGPGGLAAEDAVSRPDGGAWVLGSTEGPRAQAVLWRLTAAGAVDEGFGAGGFLALGEAQASLRGIALLASPDGTLWIGVRREAAGEAVLEVHRLDPAAALPVPVSRQPPPDEADDAPRLEVRSARMGWLSEEADPPWTAVTAPMPGSAFAAWAGAPAVAPVVVDAASAAGGAVFNPYAADAGPAARPSATAPAATAGGTGWGWAAGGLAFGALTAFLFRWFRR